MSLISGVYSRSHSIYNIWAEKKFKKRNKHKRQLRFISQSVPGNTPVTERKLRFAEKMRSAPTQSEKSLYRALKRYQNPKFGVTFRHQVVMFGYIADLWCGRYRLVIEIDGSIHQSAEQQDYDRHRNKVMLAKGLNVLRVNADWVMHNPNAAARQINEFMQRLPLFSRRGPKRKQDTAKLEKWGRDGKPLMFVNAEPSAQLSGSNASALEPI